MKNWIAKLPIKSKLMFIIMLISITGLLLAGIIIVTYDDYRGKDGILQDISSIAQLIADRSTAAIAFDDPRLAEENLASLRIKSSITSAQIHNEKGLLLARYTAAGSGNAAVSGEISVKNKDAEAILFQAGNEIRHIFEKDNLILTVPIILNEKRIGTVYINSNLNELYARRHNTLLFMAAIILLSSIVAFFLSLWLQRLISVPIAHLTKTSQHVANEKDYSVRAVKTSDDEIGLLVSAFNEMLETIDAQNKSNEQYRLRQEELIAEQQREITERRQIEMELRESEEKFQKSFMSSPDAIAITKLDDASYIDVNDNFLKLSGYTREELIGQSSFKLTIAKRKEDLDRFNAIIKKEGRACEFEAEYISKTGETGFALLSAETIKIGNELCLLKQYKDITSWKNAQKSLKESEDRYREIFEKVSAGIFQTSKEGRILIANPAFARILGYASSDELINSVKNIARDVYLNPEKRTELIDLISREGFVTNYEINALKKNKEIIRVSINKHIVKDDAGNVLYYEGTIEDITVKKRFAELKSAMNIAQLGYWEYNVANDTFVFNDEFFSIFHTTAEKCGGYELPLKRHIELFCHPGDGDSVKLEIAEAIKTKDPHYSKYIEQQITYSDTGETGYIHYQIFIAKDAEGRTVKVYGAVQDITKTKKQIVELETARETAEKATRSKSEFLAKMSHEIRTPLGAVIGLNNLLEKTELDKKQKDYVTKIKNSAAYLLQVINDILDFTKIESGKMELEKIEFSLDNILEDVGDFASIKSMGKNIEILIDKDMDVQPVLVGDPLRLKQVLLNLMTNSIKFTEKGTIILKVKSYNIIEGRIELDFSISDTGIGMTDFQIENLFQAYSQADSATTRKYGGTGLGLNICYKFIDMMGGRLCVKSEFGKGSTFYFTLPFDVSKKKTISGPHNVPENIKNINILVADDSPVFRKVIEKYVRRLGLSCYQAESGSKTIEALKEQSFDVLFIDCNLPEMNGFDTIRNIQTDSAIDKKPKVVFVTTLSNDTILKETETTGIKNILFKPLNESVIFNTIVNLFNSEERDMVRKKISQNFYPQNFDKIRGAKILIAEDNEINQQIVREILENQGFEVVMTSDGKRCIEMYQKEKNINLILMDVQMPEMDGIEATKFIRKQLNDKNIKIVALTADVINETRERIKLSGMNDFISKPIDEAELLRALVRWIEPGSIKNAGKNQPEKINDGDHNAIVSEVYDTPEIIYSEGIRRVTGNEKLYKELLKKFIVNNKKTAGELQMYIQSGDYSSLARQAHNFKGVSANLGLQSVSALAAEIQAAAEAQSDKTAGLILLLDSGLKETIKELENYLGCGTNIEEISAVSEYEFLIELKHKFENNEMEAHDFFADGKDKFEINKKGEYKGLSDAVDIYDFDAAKKELNILLEKKKGNANG